MKLLSYYEGQQYNIYALACDDGSCPAFDFLKRIKRDDPASHKALVYLLSRHADVGQIINERKSRYLNGGKSKLGKFLEFKTTQGDRLLYFYEPGRKTILAHGFSKGAKVKIEITKARTMRDQYMKEVGNG
jgi:hypothetical protein